MDEEKKEFDASNSIDPDKTEETNEAPPEEEAKEEKVDKSEVAQKRHWREKYEKSQDRISELEQKLKDKETPPTERAEDEKELQAQRYIKEQARKAYQELLVEKEREETETVRKFETEVESIMEDNPDIDEDDLLDVVEKYKVEPKTALQILKDREGGKTEKPKMPSAKRGSPSPEVKKSDDKEKTMWQIAKEAAQDFVKQR